MFYNKKKTIVVCYFIIVIYFINVRLIFYICIRRLGSFCVKKALKLIQLKIL